MGVRTQGSTYVLDHHDRGAHQPYRNLDRPCYMGTNPKCRKNGALLQIFA